jgi:hypothetical protein
LQLQARPRNIGEFSAKVTKRAGTVPLGKTAACGGPQQFEVHPGLFCGCVAVDLAAEAYFFEIRAGPDFHFHCYLPLQKAERPSAYLATIIADAPQAGSHK